MPQRLFLLDVENTGKTPYSGVMTEFGAVEFSTRDWFHGILHDSTPSPENSAIPVLTVGPGPRYTSAESAVTVGTVEYTPARDRAEVFARFVDWVAGFGDDRAVFVSDNPGHDWMFFAYHCDEAGLPNPFGHSSRRIGDLAAGLAGNWRNTSAWKRYRETQHDHNPVNDAMGNAEALKTILQRHEQMS